MGALMCRTYLFSFLLLFIYKDHIGIEMSNGLFESAIKTSSHRGYSVIHWRNQQLVKHLRLYNDLLMLLVLINVIVHQRRLVQLIISVHLFFLLFEILLELIEINYLLVLRVHPQLVYFACRRKLKVDFIAHFLDVFEERLHYLFEHISVWVQTLLVGLSYRSLRLVIR